MTFTLDGEYDTFNEAAQKQLLELANKLGLSDPSVISFHAIKAGSIIITLNVPDDLDVSSASGGGQAERLFDVTEAVDRRHVVD